jgi:hypothetical protein
MRYVNLKKRNTSKFQFVTKRLASISFACFALTAVIVVPLTSRVNEFAKVNEPEIIDIDNDYLNDGEIEVANDNLSEI